LLRADRTETVRFCRDVKDLVHRGMIMPAMDRRRRGCSHLPVDARHVPAGVQLVRKRLQDLPRGDDHRRHLDPGGRAGDQRGDVILSGYSFTGAEGVPDLRGCGSGITIE
jgi:hypothetical protein